MKFGNQCLPAFDRSARRTTSFQLVVAGMLIFFSSLSCTSGNSSDNNKGNAGGSGDGQGQNNPTNLGDPEQGFDILNRPLELNDLTFVSSVNYLNWPAVPLSNEFRSASAPDAVIGFRFKTSQPTVLEILSYLTTFRCQSNGSGSVKPDFALYELNENSRLKTRIDTLESNSKTKLNPGSYAVTVAFAPSTKCENVAVGFEASLKLAQLPQQPNPVPTGVPVPTPTQTAAPVPSPKPTPSSVPNPTPTQPPVTALGTWQVLKHEFAIGLVSRVRDLPTSAVPQPDLKCQLVAAANPYDLASSTETTIARVLPLAADSMASIEFATRSRSDNSSSILPLGTLTFFKQDGYPSNWIELLQQDLGLVLFMTNSSTCIQRPNGRRWLLGTANIPSLWPQVSAGGNNFPFKSVTLSSGKTAPDVQITYAYDAKDNGSSWQMSLGVDAEKLNELLTQNNLTDFNSVEWIVMDRKEKLPQSSWSSHTRREFFGDSNTRPVITAKGDGLNELGSLLNAPHNRSLVMRLGKKEIGPDEQFHQGRYLDLVIDHGLLCQMSYSRPDGAIWHEQIFKDLTHPEWNNSPSKDKKTGCAFAGVPSP
ncbi:MAG: hypothetical protein RL189_1760 [Pseudomonadota bacterium]